MIPPPSLTFIITYQPAGDEATTSYPVSASRDTSYSIRGAKGGRRRLVGGRQRRTPRGSQLRVTTAVATVADRSLARHSSSLAITTSRTLPACLLSAQGPVRRGRADAAVTVVLFSGCVCGHLLTSTPPN